MISRTTLWRRAQELGIATQHTTSASISDEQLDAVVRMIYLESPNNGIVMVWGQLKSLNIFVPRRRVWESLLRVCQIAVQRDLHILLVAVFTMYHLLMFFGIAY